MGSPGAQNQTTGYIFDAIFACKVAGPALREKCGLSGASFLQGQGGRRAERGHPSVQASRMTQRGVEGEAMVPRVTTADCKFY